MADIKATLKALIIDTLDLEDISPEDIIDNEPLFGDGLGLDSIDALELGLAIKKTFDVKIEANSEKTKEHFYSIDNLVKFIEQN
ncbi:phosphopantetheine-binding protein [Colwellia sp. RSH04]|uniref:phosphopantetheine-binding protein n=1 Tax=Colwellia sp. RSH04 TaxID=2305464 RepID=UPI000E5763E3|nr:phosphopantetheine-binding protein [Colwellia sp. RSH04]RHW75787.1 acyl carrier protein [Colwellia sp. RSH04]